MCAKTNFKEENVLHLYLKLCDYIIQQNKAGNNA